MLFAISPLLQLEEFKKAGATKLGCLYVGDYDDGKKWLESIQVTED